MAWSREEIIWAAGLFEGEGWISCRGDILNPSLGLGMTDHEIVRKFHSAIGGLGCLYGRRSQKERWQPQLMVQVNKFEHVQAVLVALWPWLGNRRRAKALGLLGRCKQRELVKNLPGGLVCSEEGCDRPRRARGLCSLHYNRLRSKGELPKLRTAADILAGRDGTSRSGNTGRIVGQCVIEGCEKRRHGRGLCDNHYRKAERRGVLSDFGFVPGVYKQKVI